MAVTLYTLTCPFADLSGDALDPRHAIAWVETNVGSSEGITDTSTGGQVMPGAKRIELDDDSDGTVDLPPTDSPDTIPTDFQYRVWLEYRTIKGGKVVKGRWTSGWFSFTADANLKDVIEEFYAPPTYLTQLTAALDAHEAGLEVELTALADGFMTEMTGLRDETEVFRNEAEQFRDDTVDISGISTSDGVVEALVRNTGGAGPLTTGALHDKYGVETGVPEGFPDSFVAGGDGVRIHGFLALGQDPKASHGEGTHGKAHNWNAHVEGESSIADGKIPHAEGNSCICSHNDAHVEGNRCVCGRPEFINRFPVGGFLTAGTEDAGDGLGSLRYVIIPDLYGDVRKYFPNALMDATYVTNTYGAGAVADVVGNVYPPTINGVFTPAVWKTTGAPWSPSPTQEAQSTPTARVDSQGNTLPPWGSVGEELVDALVRFDGATVSGTAATNDTITAAAHGLVATQPIQFTTVVDGLEEATTYWVRDVTTNTFKVTDAIGGNAVNITAAGAVVAVTSDHLIAANDIQWAMHSVCMLRGNPSETAIAYARIAKATYTAGVGTKVYYHGKPPGSTGDIQGIIGSYSAVVLSGGNGGHVEGFRNAGVGYGHHIEGRFNLGIGDGIHVEGRENIGIGNYSTVSGYQNDLRANNARLSGLQGVVTQDYEDSIGYAMRSVRGDHMVRKMVYGKTHDSASGWGTVPLWKNLADGLYGFESRVLGLQTAGPGGTVGNSFEYLFQGTIKVTTTSGLTYMVPLGPIERQLIGRTGPVNEVQTLTVTGSPTGGTFTVTFGANTTTSIAYNATAAVVQAALEALASIGVGQVNVTSINTNGGPWRVEFIGSLGGADQAAMTVTTSLTGGTSPSVTVATIRPGAASTMTGDGLATGDRLSVENDLYIAGGVKDLIARLDQAGTTTYYTSSRSTLHQLLT